MKKKSLDHKILLDILLQTCRKGLDAKTMEAKDIVEEFVHRLRPFYGQVQKDKGGQHE